MRSRHADRFNHDDDAATYDRSVRNESDPIRAGYDALLSWVAEGAEVDPASRVLDLGSGTGNLARRLPHFETLVCVDVSLEMTRLAREKLADRPGVEFVTADLLEYFDRPGPAFDAVLSTYAIHHLLEDEKRSLFERIAARLAPGGRAVVRRPDVRERLGTPGAPRGPARERRERARRRHRGGVLLGRRVGHRRPRVPAARVVSRRFSQLSWGLRATRKPRAWLAP